MSYFAPQGGSSLTLSSGATFDNKAGATFAFITDGPITAGTGGGSFINEGALSKTGGTGTSTVGVTLNTTGTIQSNSGILSLLGGGAFSGTSSLSAASASQIKVSGGSYSLADATVLTVSGTVILDGTTITVPTGSATIGGPLSLSSGSIGGAGTLTFTSPLAWTGGTMSGTGTTNANAGLTFGSPGTTSSLTLDGRTLNNFGAATLAAVNVSYGLYLSSGATFDNKPGAASPSPPTRRSSATAAHLPAAASSTRGR